MAGMSALYGRGGAFAFFFIGKMPSESIGGGSDPAAVFNKHICCTKAEYATRAFKIAVANGYVHVIKSRNTVITGGEGAIFNQNIVAGSDIKSVMTA